MKERDWTMSSKKTIQPKSINLDIFQCPICKRIGQYHKDDYETTCECGLVLLTSYPYTAGIKFKTISDHTNKTKKQKKKRRKTKWK